MILGSRSLSLHRTFNLQYLFWKPASQTSRPECWKKNNNNDKTEAFLVRSSSKSISVSKPSIISVCGCEISFSCSARNHGFYITDDIGVELHIKNVCQSAYSELRRISTIRHLLSIDSTRTLGSAFVLSRLDYCNSLLSGCCIRLLEKVQMVQKSAASS